MMRNCHLKRLPKNPAFIDFISRNIRKLQFTQFTRPSALIWFSSFFFPFIFNCAKNIPAKLCALYFLKKTIFKRQSIHNNQKYLYSYKQFSIHRSYSYSISLTSFFSLPLSLSIFSHSLSPCLSVSVFLSFYLHPSIYLSISLFTYPVFRQFNFLKYCILFFWVNAWSLIIVNKISSKSIRSFCYPFKVHSDLYRSNCPTINKSALAGVSSDNLTLVIVYVTCIILAFVAIYRWKTMKF